MWPAAKLRLRRFTLFTRVFLYRLASFTLWEPTDAEQEVEESPRVSDTQKTLKINWINSINIIISIFLTW